MIYLDHNATTRPAPEAVQEMLDVLGHAWANTSSQHGPGQDAKRALGAARAVVARVLGCKAVEVVFTSGATESNHHAVLGALRAGRPQGRWRVVMSAVEHPGLIALGQRLKDEGGSLSLIPVNARGELDLAAAERLIGPDVAIVSVMGANNETGVLMPLAEVARLAHAQGALLHVDATQLVGKSMLRFADSGADLWSVSAHKLHGPKGCGALLIRKGVLAPTGLPPLLSGRQERNRRGGTENLPGIAGFAAAAERMSGRLAADLAHMAAMRDRLEAGLRDLLGEDLVIYGAGTQRLPNTSCVRFGALESERVLGKLERAGVIASSGAACTASGTQPSHVLLAMGCSAAQARAGVRFSLGRDTTPAQIRRTVEAAARVVHPLMQVEQPAPALAQAA